MELKFKRVGGIIYAGIKPFTGRTKWVSLKTHDMTIAKQRAKEAHLFKMQAVESVNALSATVFARLKDAESVTVSSAIDNFIRLQEEKKRSTNTIASLRAILSQWMRQAGVGSKLTHEIEPGHFKDFFNPGDDTKLRSLQVREYACSRFCEYCQSLGLMNSNKAKATGIDTSNLKQAQLLTDSHKPMLREELDKILKVVHEDPFWYMACLIAWEFGLRISDVCLLERVSLVDDKLRLITRKTKTSVTLPLTDDIVKRINALNPERFENDGDFVFPNQRAEYLTYGNQPFSKEFREICRRAGVVGKTFHSFRTAFINRTFAEKKDSILAQLSEELAKRQTAAAAGHQSTAATDIYLKAGKPQGVSDDSPSKQNV